MANTRDGNVSINNAADFAKYMKNHNPALTAEGQEALENAGISLDMPENQYRLRDLSDDDKAKCIAAIITNDSATVIDLAGNILRIYENDQLQQLATPAKNAAEWVNPTMSRIIKGMLANNGADYDDPSIPMTEIQIKSIMSNAQRYAADGGVALSDSALASFSQALTKSPVDAYINHVNGKDINAVNIDAVKEARIEVDKQLADNNNPFTKHLAQLPEAEKIAFISALVNNDRAAIASNLEKAPLENKTSIAKELGNIGLYLPQDDKNYMNDTTRLMVHKMLMNADGKNLNISALDRILTNAMSRIDDTKIDLRTKNQIVKSIDPDVSKLFVGYNEYVKPLEKSKMNGRVSLNEFEKATSSNKVDYSQFILLSLGALQNAAESNPQVAAAVNEVRKNYMNIKYEDAIVGIKAICSPPLASQLSSNAANSEQLAKTISSKADQLSPDRNEVNIETNYSRRFLENRVAAVQFGNTNNYDAINKVGRHFMGKDYEDAKDTASAVQTLTSVPEHEDPQIMSRKTELTKKYSGDYSKKGRELKENFYAQENEPTLAPDKKVDSSFSSNPGVMRSTQPNYRDELTDTPLRNPQPDVNTYVNSDEYYPLQNNRSAYVASISGHTYYMVALLEDYMQKNPGPTLNDDMNNFMQSFVATYVGRGYHSYLECVHVLQEEAIKDVFAKHGVTINPDLPDHIMNEAFKDTQTYTKTTGVAAVARTDMKADMKELLTAINKGDAGTIRSMLKQNAGLRHTLDENGQAFLQIAQASGNKAVIEAMSTRHARSDLNSITHSIKENMSEPATKSELATKSEPVVSAPVVDSKAVIEARDIVEGVLQHDAISSRIRGMDDADKVQAITAILARDSAAIVDTIGARIGLYETKDTANLTEFLSSDKPSLANATCKEIIGTLLSENSGDGDSVPMAASKMESMLNHALDDAQKSNPAINDASRGEFIKASLATAKNDQASNNEPDTAANNDAPRMGR